MSVVKYHLVRFSDSSLNVISQKWMLTNSTCAYPNFTSDTSFIKCVKRHVPPGDNWEVYDVKILYSHENFEKVWKKIREAELTSDINSSVDEKRRKRRSALRQRENLDNTKHRTVKKSRRRANDDYEDSEEADDDDADSDAACAAEDLLPPLPIPPTHAVPPVATPVMESALEISHEIADVSLDQPDATSTPNPQSRTQKNLGITHRHQVPLKGLRPIQCSSRGMFDRVTIPPQRNASVGASLTPEEAAATVSDNSLTVDTSLHRDATSGGTNSIVTGRGSATNGSAIRRSSLTNLTAFEQYVIQTLEDLKSEGQRTRQLCQTAVKMVTANNDCSLPDGIGLPLMSVHEVNNLEERIQKDSSARMQLINYLALCGGASTKICVANIMEAVLSNELSRQYSLTGNPPPIPNPKKKMPFRDLQLYRVVIAAVKKNPILSAVTADDVKEAIKTWLNNARDRGTGRHDRYVRSVQNRQQPNQPGEVPVESDSDSR